MGKYAKAVGMAVAAFSLGVANARSVEGWTLVDLGTLGGPGSYGAALSDSGIAVGCADVDAASAHAFIYRDGARRDLGPGCALAVNDRGTVAGRSPFCVTPTITSVPPAISVAPGAPAITAKRSARLVGRSKR